jgi:hypothetical protein
VAAEANYNGRVSSSLTPVLIQQQYLARWDGRLPQYSLGGNVVPFIQIPGAPAPEAPRRCLGLEARPNSPSARSS